MKKEKKITKGKDYLFVSIIALSFSFFLIPIFKNIFPFGINFSVILVAVLILPILASLAFFIASLIAKKIPVFLQLAKFVAVGVFNTFLDWGIVNLLMLVTQIFAGIWYSIFNVFSFIVANIGSFFWNRYWIFPDQKKQNKESNTKDFLQFFIVSVIGLGVKVGIASFLVNFVNSSFDEKIWANIGLLMGTIFSMVWNFLGYKFIVFKK